MSKITVNQNETKELQLGRIVISLDLEYAIIMGKKYDLTEVEYYQIKKIIEDKIITLDNYISKDIKSYENLKEKNKDEGIETE